MQRQLMCMLLSGAAVLAGRPAAAQQPTPVTPVALASPDGALELSVATVRRSAVEAQGQLAYRVTFHGKTVLDWSNLGLMLEGAPPLGGAVRIDSQRASSRDETWRAVAGKASAIRNHYRSVVVEAVEPGASGRRLDVEARAYDDGVAFRYIVPAQPSLSELRVTNEATQFHFSKDATTWSLILRDFHTSSEDDYHQLTLQALHPEVLGRPARAVGCAGRRLGGSDRGGYRRLGRPVRARHLGAGHAHGASGAAGLGPVGAARALAGSTRRRSRRWCRSCAARRRRRRGAC